MATAAATSMRHTADPLVPRWAERTARAVALAPLPSFLWRLPMAFGVPMGFSSEFMENLHAPGWGSLYVVVLGLFTEVLAVLCLGLVRPWGETWPRWVPRLGGTRVPTLVAVVPASFGSAGLTLFSIGYLYTSFVAEASGPQGPTMWAMHLCYMPVLLWGPLLAALTVHYYRRRTGR